MNVPTALVALAECYVANFADGSSSPVDVRGWYGRCLLIGIATRGDGKKRCLVFNEKGSLDQHDDWLDPPLMITRLTASGVTREEKGG